MVDINSISAGLQLGDDGIWYGAEIDDISYPPEGYDSCFAVEENSFWFKHRNNCISSVVSSFPPDKNGTIFDIGGGNGFVSLGLVKSGFEVALVEPGKVGALNAKKRGLANVICATTSAAKFAKQSLPAVGLFDVIEHIENDVAFLKSIRISMQKNARLYATVPAYSLLWSKQDVVAGHFRRYNIESISEVLRKAGFDVEFSSYIFRFLPIPIFFLRTLPFKLGFSKKAKMPNKTSTDHRTNNGLISKLLNYLLKSEFSNLEKGKVMKFGGSCLIVAKSRSESN